MEWARSFNHLAVGLGALGALVLGILSLSGGLVVLAAVLGVLALALLLVLLVLVLQRRNVDHAVAAAPTMTAHAAASPASPERTVALVAPRSKPSARVVRRVFVLPPESHQVVALSVDRRDVVHGTVDSDAPISFWLVDERNLRKFERDQSFDFEDGAEDVLEGTLHSGPDLPSELSLVVANEVDEDGDEAEVTVELHIGRE